MDSTFCRAIITDKKNRYKKRACCNYARTGFVSCYSHRKIETPEYSEKVVKDFVQAAIDKVIYNMRMDYINKYGWDEYCKQLESGKI